VKVVKSAEMKDMQERMMIANEKEVRMKRKREQERETRKRAK
jgi:hypothetical protein